MSHRIRTASTFVLLTLLAACSSPTSTEPLATPHSPPRIVNGTPTGTQYPNVGRSVKLP
jgi:hypothetical protein